MIAACLPYVYPPFAPSVPFVYPGNYELHSVCLSFAHHWKKIAKIFSVVGNNRFWLTIKSRITASVDGNADIRIKASRVAKQAERVSGEANRAIGHDPETSSTILKIFIN